MYTHEKNTIHFSESAVQNEPATNRMGRAMFDTILRIHITVPGDNKSVQTYEVDREYAEGHPIKSRRNEAIYARFGKYIEEYKKNAASGATTGMPIEKWAMIDVRMAATLKHHGIYTVEQLADLSDSNIGKIGMGGRDLVRKAKDWIQSASNSALATQLSAEKQALNDKLAGMQEQIDALAEALGTLDPEQQAKVQASLGKRGRKAAA
jgi:hypothetical protein